jgi:ribulose-phosphate 3-epimerase
VGKIFPSVMCADFKNIIKEVTMLDKVGADYIHFDVMDGHFVPNFALGTDIPRVLGSIR